MGTEKARKEALRWYDTAQSDLDTARILSDNGKHAHACFHAQQAGEKAIKSVWCFADVDPWGHSSQKLISDLQEIDVALYESLEELIPKASKLDRFYIPTRYPNGLPDLIPEQAFFPDDAQSAIAFAESILAVVKGIISVDS